MSNRNIITYVTIWSLFLQKYSIFSIKQTGSISFEIEPIIRTVNEIGSEMDGEGPLLQKVCCLYKTR